MRCTSGHFCDVRTGERGSYNSFLYGFDAVGGVFLGTDLRFRWCRTIPVLPGETLPPLIGYRCAVDDSTLWTGPFLEETTQFPPAAEPPWVPPVGPHGLYVECLDRAGELLTGQFRFLVVPGPSQQDPPPVPRILLVDDNGSRDSNYSEWRQFTDQVEDAFWLGGDQGAGVLDGYAVDQFDTQREDGAPQIPFLANYTTVIWNAGLPSGGGGTSWLRDQLFGPRAEYLTSYVRAGGNLLIVGMNPLFAMAITCPTTGLLGDVCCVTPTKGPWLTFDRSLCAHGEEDPFAHFLLTRLGCRQMRVPVSDASVSDSVWVITPDRVVRGCRPADPSGLFNRYLKVDSLKAGGPFDNTPGQDRIDWIPAANVASRTTGLEDWVESIYYVDASDPDMPQDYVIGILARGDLNPRRPATEPDWGDVVFLGSHLFFYRTEDATWFLRTVLSDVFGESP